MLDGHALVEISTKGKVKLKECHFYDIRLYDCDIEEDMAEQILLQLPDVLNDVLVLAIFKVEWLMSYHPEDGHECDGVVIHLENHHVVVDNYKEFYREQLTELIKFEDDISEWEEFYDEEFTPFIKNVRSFKDINLF